MWFRVVASIGVVATLLAAAVWSARKIDAHFADYNSKTARVAELEIMLTQSRNEIRALQDARKLDIAEAVDQYESADWACDTAIKQVIAGNRVKPIKEYVNVESPSMCPEPEPMYRVQDLQRAGTAADTSGDNEGSLPASDPQ